MKLEMKFSRSTSNYDVYTCPDKRNPGETIMFYVPRFTHKTGVHINTFYVNRTTNKYKVQVTPASAQLLRFIASNAVETSASGVYTTLHSIIKECNRIIVGDTSVFTPTVRTDIHTVDSRLHSEVRGLRSDIHALQYQLANPPQPTRKKRTYRRKAA